MIIYIFYWILFSLISFIELIICNIKNKEVLYKTISFLSLLALVFLLGLRWNTGTDWLPYLNFFKWSYSTAFFEEDSYMDYGYVLFNNFCYLLSENYTVLLVTHAFVFYSLMYKNFQNFTPYLILAIFIYTASNFGMVGSNRQLLAVAIGIYSVCCYYKGKYYLAAFFFIIALLFHNTAILLLVYPFLNRQLTVKQLIVLVVTSIILSQSGLVNSIFSSLGSLGDTSQGKVDAYLDYVDEYKGLSIIGIVRRVLIVFVFFYLSKRLRRELKYFDVIFNSYLISVLSFLAFSSIPIIAGRGMLYFNFAESILFTYLLLLPHSRKLKIVIWFFLVLLVIVLFIQSINLYSDLFIPYEGIFINTGYNRQTY